MLLYANWNKRPDFQSGPRKGCAGSNPVGSTVMLLDFKLGNPIYWYKVKNINAPLDKRFKSSPFHGEEHGFESHTVYQVSVSSGSERNKIPLYHPFV